MEFEKILKNGFKLVVTFPMWDEKLYKKTNDKWEPHPFTISSNTIDSHPVFGSSMSYSCQTFANSDEVYDFKIECWQSFMPKYKSMLR